MSSSFPRIGGMTFRAMTAGALVRSLLAALVLAAIPAAAFADVDVRTEMGHAGSWTEDVNAPVTVQLRNSGSSPVVVRIALSDSDRFSGGSYRHERSVALGPGAVRREVFLVPGPTTFSSSLTVALTTEPRTTIQAGGTAFTRGVASVAVTNELARGGRVPLSGRIIGVLAEGGVSAFADPLRRASGVWVEGDEIDTVAVISVDPAMLSIAPLALAGLDALVVVAPSAGFAVDAREREGLLAWVALGGRLVFGSPEDLAGVARGPLGPELPADVTSIGRQSYSAFLTAHTDLLPAKLRPKLPPKSTAGPFAELRPRPGGRATGIAFGGGRSRVERAFGQGTIVMLAYDLRPALSAADVQGGRYAERLATEITGREAPMSYATLRDQALDFGMSRRVDVDTELQSVLSHGAFAPPPFPLVLGALLLYVIAVGPLDYLVLKRLGKQRLTTFTFAASVIVFTALAYGASFLVFARGAVVNRVVFVDLASAGADGQALARVTDLAGFYSPVGSTTELSYSLPAAIGGSGLPGSVSTGDIGRSLAIAIEGTAPTQPRARVEVAFRSQRNVCSVLAGPSARSVDVLIKRSGAATSAEVTNGLPVALHEVALIAPNGRGQYDVGDIAPGETVTIPLGALNRARGSRFASGQQDLGGGEAEREVRTFLTFLSRVGTIGIDGAPPRKNEMPAVDPNRAVQLAKSGIGHGDALARGRALLIGFADESPFPLPADDENGRTYVVVRKEIDL